MQDAKFFLRGILLAWLILLPAAGTSAQYLDHDGYRIHYTTFSSIIIPPDVAELHNIVRAQNRVVLNVSAIREDMPAALTIKGTVTNLLNQQFDLEFQEVTESEAIYYLASHLAIEQDVLRFSLLVELASGEVLPIKFLRRYD